MKRQKFSANDNITNEAVLYWMS